MNHEDTRTLVALALREDIGTGDLTTTACVDPDREAVGRYYARQDCIAAGAELLEFIYDLRGGVRHLHILATSGQRVVDGQMVAEVRGRACTLLECERVSLNFIQRLSGIATVARQYSDAVAHTKCRVLDTRKTTPGMRRLE